jgi:hypothetical protein
MNPPDDFSTTLAFNGPASTIVAAARKLLGGLVKEGI